ncbi:MAG: hypothetical protein JWN76_1482 [Chitinophagaceae bacterium]|nr:hypothetical protein [Chitinophagaceae bacterium]
MKHLFYITFVTVLITGCHTAKKAQRIEEAISKKDTVQAVVITKATPVDSIAIGRNLIQRVNAHTIDFNTFSAKVKVAYEDKDDNGQGTANFRMKRDSIIWVSLTGPLNVEAFRAFITKDSIILMNVLKKTVQYRSISYLQDLVQIPFDFKTLQNLIVGNPIFLDNNVVSYKVKENETLVLMVGQLFKNLLTLDNNATVLHSKLDDLDAARNRTCDITYSDYQSANGFMFSTKRKLTVAENNRLNIDMDFKKFEFNPPLTFPFNIPKNYKIK